MDRSFKGRFGACQILWKLSRSQPFSLLLLCWNRKGQEILQEGNQDQKSCCWFEDIQRIIDMIDLQIWDNSANIDIGSPVFDETYHGFERCKWGKKTSMFAHAFDLLCPVRMVSPCPIPEFVISDWIPITYAQTEGMSEYLFACAWKLVVIRGLCCVQEGQNP